MPAAPETASATGFSHYQYVHTHLKDGGPDAGMRELDHYASRLPRYRYDLRQWLMPVVRLETPYLALLQNSLRSPALDTYFALAANLGTHTFFMVMLPHLFWCGYSDIGQAMVFMLASGVYWSGFVKDMLCVPRPLSPPLQRITMSGSAALEYGFPSTHSTNAVSVAVYAIYRLHQASDDALEHTKAPLQILLYLYALSIIFGRLYCGMHGFVDVIAGSSLGAAIAALQISQGPAFYAWLCGGGYVSMTVVAVTILVLIRVHPEPADDCPCFDDSVAFAGTQIGILFGAWRFASSYLSVSNPVPATVSYTYEHIGFLNTCLRVILGISLIVAWRGIAKSLLLKYLPRLFRVLEHLDLSLPRKFELRASQYTRVPKLHHDDNVLPSASDIPKLLTSLRHPRRRTVSIGPQSPADAYETLAYRQRRRRLSRSSMSPERSPSTHAVAHKSDSPSPAPLGAGPTSSPAATSPIAPTHLACKIQSYERLMGSANLSETPSDDISTEKGDGIVEDRTVVGEPESDEESRRKEKKELFQGLLKPRVRYDVEVVTKLIVYFGIGWLATEINPILFEMVGLGMGSSPLLS